MMRMTTPGWNLIDELRFVTNTPLLVNLLQLNGTISLILLSVLIKTVLLKNSMLSLILLPLTNQVGPLLSAPIEGGA